MKAYSSISKAWRRASHALALFTIRHEERWLALVGLIVFTLLNSLTMAKHNLINDIGLTADSTHYTASEKTTPRGLRKIFTMKRFELQFPLKHPRYVIDNVAYKERLYRRNAWGHPWIKIGRSLEELVLNLRYGHFQAISKAIGNRLRKTFGKKV